MTDPAELAGWTHERMLSVLSRCDASRLKGCAEALLPALGEVDAIDNRTGLVMLPMRDTAQGTHFHLGEVLVSEARIHAAGHDGYGMRRGRDLEAAMAMAVLDLAVSRNVHHDACRSFLEAEATTLADEDAATLRKVEATRVDMETF